MTPRPELATHLLVTMIKIVTDSTAYISAEMAQKYDISVIPLHVHFGTKTYRDGIDLSNEQFYQMLRQARELPTTSQPPPADFLEVFRRLTDAGHEVIALTISSKLSGTYLSAFQAREALPDARITIVDSLAAATPLAMMATWAARAAIQGWSHEEILALLREAIANMQIVFMLNTLEYLHKGGRIGPAAVFIGTLLNVKPILVLENGAVGVIDRVRTKKKAVERILTAIEERVGKEHPVSAAVMHIQSLEEAHRLEEQIRSRFHCNEVYLSEIGPVVGTHTGPGTLGLAAIADPFASQR